MYEISKNDSFLVISNLQRTLTQSFRCIDFIEKKLIYGVYGIFFYLNSKYLILITAATKKGFIFQNEVFEIKEIDILLLEGHKNISAIQKLKSFFSSSGFYFSSYPLHLSYSNLFSEEKTFLFNSYPLSLYKNECKHFYVNVIQGYFSYYKNLYLISRRSTYNIGPRYLCRGLNNEFYPSNFVETEQIFNKKSFVQIRGSIPLTWSHKLNYKYNPDILIKEDNFFIKSHIKLLRKYKNLIYLNLIQDKGYEGPLYQAFNKELIKNKIKHINFNFNKNINKTLLINKIKKIKFYKNKKQITIIRSNCIDSLDRTNVTQYFIGEIVLKKELNEFLKEKKEYLKAFKNLFFENGNYLSKQYSGTPSLKSSYIFEGKRTFLCLIRDFYYSIKRYFINRNKDYEKKKIYDVITGKSKDNELEKDKNNIDIIIFLLIALLIFYLKSNKSKILILLILIFTNKKLYLLLILLYLIKIKYIND